MKNETSIKVSVIMPAYNVEKYIEKSVKSVMDQTLSDIELIIVNDASTDSTWDKICELRDLYGERIVAIDLERNLRQGGARNRAIKVARGKYLSFVDSDDWIREDMLEKFYSAITASDADLVGTGSYYMYYSDEKIKTISSDPRLVTELSGKIANKEIRDKYYFCIGGIWRNIFKKEICIENNIWFPEGVSYEDNYFVNLYLGYVKKYVCVDEPFYFYRQNENSTVHRKDLTQLQRIDVEKMLLSELLKRGLYDEVKDGYDLMAIQRWYINTLGLIYGRFGKDSISIAKQVGKEFRDLHPQYRKNKYFRTEIKKIDRFKLRIFEISPLLLYLMYKVKNRK